MTVKITARKSNGQFTSATMNKDTQTITYGSRTFKGKHCVENFAAKCGMKNVKVK